VYWYLYIKEGRWKEIMNGKNQQIKGKLRELEGRATLNMGQVIKGKAEQRVGKVREKWQKTKASIWVE